MSEAIRTLSSEQEIYRNDLLGVLVIFVCLTSCCPGIPILLDLLRRQEKDGVSCKKRSTITNRNHFHVRGIFTRFALWKIVSVQK